MKHLIKPSDTIAIWESTDSTTLNFPNSHSGGQNVGRLFFANINKSNL